MKKSFMTIVFLILISSLFCEIISGKVISVKDGDTIEILYKGQAVRIRLYAVDSPEKDQDFGNKAKLFTSQLVFSKIVKADIKSKDMYGRSVAEVFLTDGRSLNQELLKNGFAWHYKAYNSEERLSELENKAKEKRLGLWSGKNPQAPWEFRKDKKSSIKAPSKPASKKSELKGGMYIASLNSKKYHRNTCPYAKKIPKQNRVYFNSVSSAKAEGYEACNFCKP